MSTEEEGSGCSGEAAFDPAKPWALDAQVSLRPEPFGALAYHFGTRRLSFLTSTRLLDVVESLEAKPSAREACRAAGVTEGELDIYERALATLASRGMIRERIAP